LAASAVPKQLAGATNLKLAQLYEQLNASFGRFSQDTLVAATAGIKSTDETKYASVDAALTTLTARREVVAGKIKTALNRAAFNLSTSYGGCASRGAGSPSFVSRSAPVVSASSRPTGTTRAPAPRTSSTTVGRPLGSRAVVTTPDGLCSST